MKNLFQKYVQLLLIIFLGFTVACRSNSEEFSTEPADLIVGKWSISTIDQNISINGVALDAIPPSLLGLSELENELLTLFLGRHSSSLFDGFLIEFFPDGTTSISSENITETGISYSILAENELIIQFDDGNDWSIEILNLTETDLEVIINEQIQTDLTEDGINEIIDAEIVFQLLKQQ